jgi:iron complex outermembrane receptor protein
MSGALLSVYAAAATAQDASVTNDTVVVTGTALKVDTPLIETSRSASVVTEEDIQRRAVDKYDEALQYRAGVVSQPYGSDNNSDWFLLRGFSAEGSTFQDGLRVFRTGGYFWWLTEPFGVERVDYLKGPASILYGAAPPGGVINAISKRPTEDARGLLEIEGGTDEHRQFGIDTSGPVAGTDDMRYRLVGLYSDGDDELDGTDSERFYFAPSLAVDLSDDTTVTFLASVQKDTGTPSPTFFPAYGTVGNTPFGDIDRDTNLGQPDYDDFDQRQVTLGYELEHRLSDTWEFQQSLRYSNLDMDLRQVYPNSYVAPGSREISRGVVDRDGEYDAISVDNRLIATTYTDNTENTFLVGAGYQKLSLDYTNADSFRTLGDGSSYYQAIDTVDIFEPDHGAFTRPQTGDPTDHDVRSEQIGGYVQNQLRLYDRWILLAGARYDSVNGSDRFNDETGSSSEGYNDSQVSWTGGVMYLGDYGISPYLSYSESFTPLASLDNSGNSYKPLEGRQYEVGVKYTPPGFDGYFTLAAFDLKEDNSLIPSETGVQEQAGERHSQGIELEGVGYITDALRFTASYTYTDTRVDINSSLQDQRAPLIPYHMASAWLDYDMRRFVDGLSVGGGLRYMGESSNSADATPDYTVPDYTLVDAMVSYDIDTNWTVQVNAKNLTDKEYVSGCDFYCYYGESRSVIGSLKYRW